jgi:hypothetical protein
MEPFVLITARRKRIIIAVVGALLVILFIVLHPLARALAQAAARERGWTAQIRSVRFGWRGLWFERMHAKAAATPEFQVSVGAALLPWSALLGQKRLQVFGGEIRAPSNLEAIKRGLDEPARTLRVASARSRWKLQFSGLTVTWQSASHETQCTAWGIAGQASSQALHASADRIEGHVAPLDAVLMDAAIDLRHGREQWVIDKASSRSGAIVLDSSSSKPREQPRSTPSARAATGQSKNSARLPADHPRDAIERVAGAFLELRSQTERLRQMAAEFVAPEAIFEIGEVNFRWQHRDQKLDIGPLHAQGKRDADQMTWTLEQLAQGNADRRYLALRVPNQASKIELEVEVGSVSLQTLGVKQDDFGLRRVDESKLGFEVKMSIDELSSVAEWQASGELLDVNMEQPWLAPRLIEGIQGSFAGTGSVKWQPDFAFKVKDLSLSVGKARLELTAELKRTAQETAADVKLRVPLAACQDLVEALPRGLAPLAAQVRLDGTLSLQAAVHFDTARPSAADVKWNLANACRVRSVAGTISPERFRAPFILEVPDEHSNMVERAFGPGTASWVPLAEMSSHLQNAVLVCEDGRFFNHNGFDTQAIRNSIRENLSQGRFARGASTVSMQLAKNLYLRREKTFSRKLQEAVLTLLLEQSFTKDEMMELYLNVVELGPSIYGVGEASRFYFNTTPAGLSPLQAYYLMSLLPNPKVLHFAKDGHVSPGWLKLLRHLMTVAHQRHYLSDDELKVALEQDLIFGMSDTAMPLTVPVSPSDDGEGLIDSHDAIER